MTEDLGFEVRCPVGPQRLFLKLVEASEELPILELACGDCARRLKRQGLDVVRVLHRYTVSGELIETIVIGELGHPMHYKI